MPISVNPSTVRPTVKNDVIPYRIVDAGSSFSVNCSLRPNNFLHFPKHTTAVDYYSFSGVSFQQQLA